MALDIYLVDDLGGVERREHTFFLKITNAIKCLLIKSVNVSASLT